MVAGKKNVVIKNRALNMGGGEVILLNVLKNLNKQKYNISLIITDDYGEDNVFLPDVPDGIDVYFLRPVDIVQKYVYYFGLKKRNFFQKIMYNLFISKCEKMAKTRCIEAISKIAEKYGEVDVFVDFDCSARRYIDKIHAHKKILWRHLSFETIGSAKRVARFFRYVSGYDKIVTICETMYNELSVRAPNLKKRSYIAYNPIDLVSIKNKSLEESSLTEIEREYIQDNYIVTVARLAMEQKDYDTLLEAYKIAKEKGFTWKLYVVGDGADRTKIQELIDNKGLNKDVLLLGQKKNPFVFMKNAKFFVLSSKNEGLPTVVIEALSLSVPVISSDCPTGPAEILQNGKYGKLVPVGDAETMADRFMELYNNSILRENYAIAGSIRAQDFSIEKTMKVIEQIIDE